MLFAAYLSSNSVYAENTCACGNRSVLLVLAEFPEYQHLSTRAEISRAFFGQVARYYSEVSYGKLTVSGNTTNWITLPKLYDQYRLANDQLDLLGIAKDSFGAASQTFNFSSFNDLFLVLSFYPSLTADYVSVPNSIVTKSGMVAAFSVVEEDRDWLAYARALGLMIGLSKHSELLPGLGQFDIVSGGQGDMSAWSKITLGWINESQIVRFAAPPSSRIVSLNSLERAAARNLALRIDLKAGGEYLIENRQPLGYDRNSLQEYGVIVFYVPPGNSSIEFRRVLTPDDVGNSIFMDLKADLSVVVLNVTQAGYRLLISNIRDGRDARETLYSISRAIYSIDTAQAQNRTEGIDLAEKLLRNAQSLFALGRFMEAEALALSAESTASDASVPSDFDLTVQLIAQAETLKNNTESLVSSQSLSIVKLAKAKLDTAKEAFSAKNFTSARQDAQAAINLFNRAKEVDFMDTIFAWGSNLALLIPVAVLAYAIRYQLKTE